MRSIKKLLQVMLDNQQCFSYGLCHWGSSLYGFDLVSSDEWFILLTYIHKNRPKIFEKGFDIKHFDDAYFWEMGDIEPRIKWIKRHIKKQK